MITRKKKEEIYEMMTQNWETAQSFVFYNYEKMDNENLAEFRKIVNGAKCKAVVTKNTLFLKSAENAGIEFDKELADSIFCGMTGAVFSTEDPLEAPKIVKDFVKGKKTPKIKGGYFEGKLLSKEQVIKLASVPPREVLLAQVAFCFNGPARNLAVVLNNTMTKLCWALNAVKETKEN
jgi:large subunit ribosomal protein L10